MRTKVITSINYPGLPFIRYEVPNHWRKRAQIQWPQVQVYSNQKPVVQHFTPLLQFTIQESFDFFNPEEEPFLELDIFSEPSLQVLENTQSDYGVQYERKLQFVNKEKLLTELTATATAPVDDPIAVLEAESVINSLKVVAI